MGVFCVLRRFDYLTEIMTLMSTCTCEGLVSLASDRLATHQRVIEPDYDSTAQFCRKKKSQTGSLSSQTCLVSELSGLCGSLSWQDVGENKKK